MSYKLPIANITAFAPGNTATITLPAGKGAPTVDQVNLIFGGGMIDADIESIRVKANGKIIWDEGTGVMAKAREAYKGIYVDDAFLTLDFTNVRSKNGTVEQYLTAIPAATLNSLTVEVKLSAGLPGAATMKAEINYRPPTSNQYVNKLFNRSETFNGASSKGAPHILYLPTQGAGGKLLRLWVHESVPGVVKEAEIRVGSNIVWEGTRAAAEFDQKRAELVPQAGLFVMDFMVDGSLIGHLDTENVSQVEARFVMSATSQLTTYYEVLDPLSRL